MWTGNKPPPLPSSAITSRMKITPRPQDNELEALRQRGLTTLLNRHFTETTQKVAAERAAADAAMADLQARKAATSKFVPSKDGELSPLDQLCVRVNQWQKETRKKERETLLLYQRYVNKFGASGHVQVPSTPTNRSSYIPSTPSWAIAESPDSKYSPQAVPPPSTPSYVPTIAKKIEAALTEYLEAGGMEMPSMESLGKDQTYQEVFAKHENEFKNYYRRQLEARGVDAKTSRKWAEKEDHNANVEPAVGQNESLLPTIGEEKLADNIFGDDAPYFINQDFEDADDRSLVSGLTTLNSAETRRVLRDCERSVATFLRDEHEAIRRMMVEEGSDESSTSSDIGSITKAADQAENLVKEMQTILDDFTVKSAKVTDFDEEDASVTQKAGGRRYHTSNPDEDWVAYYNEAYKREYYHERNTNRTQWDPPDVDVTSQSNSQSSPDELGFDEVMPERPRGSRYAQYRLKQRRARKRRVLALVSATVVAATVGAGSFFYANYTVPPPATCTAMEVSPISLKDTLQSLETERLRVLEEERLRLFRPWYCNLPLSYMVHARCRRLASENPLFDLQALVNYMFQ